MAYKNPERRAQTRAHIMDVFWELYSANPRKAITVSAIVAQANIHRSTFYEYFDSAAAVLTAIEDELADIFVREVKQALGTGSGSGSGTSSLASAEMLQQAQVVSLDSAEIVQQLYVNHGDKLSVLLGDNGDPSFARKIKDALGAIVQFEFSKDAFTPYLVEFAFSGVLAAAAKWYEEGQVVPPEQFGAGIRDLLISVASCVRE